MKLQKGDIKAYFTITGFESKAVEPGAEKESKVEFVQSSEPPKPKLDELVYICPMHPEVILDKLGKCPKCGMNLIKKEKATSKKHED